ncbi:hypothetical protein BDV59DRAFT_29574 [Aspergillus ambiguus]|uniref:uncharacterized protein n=1 Tax=Aspergillus ambiguus TaxID=176160 RepID=UPI003CCD9948
MAIYLAIPIIDELVRHVEDDPESNNAVQAMVAAVLNYYYSPQNGYGVSFGQHRNDTRVDAIITRIQSDFPGDRRVVDHMYVNASRSSDPIYTSLGELGDSLRGLSSEVQQCWAIVVQGRAFKIYSYQKEPEGDYRLVPWFPPTVLLRNPFDVRDDAAVIDWMLRHIAKAEISTARRRVKAGPVVDNGEVVRMRVK